MSDLKLWLIAAAVSAFLICSMMLMIGRCVAPPPPPNVHDEVDSLHDSKGSVVRVVRDNRRRVTCYVYEPRNERSSIACTPDTNCYGDVYR